MIGTEPGGEAGLLYGSPQPNLAPRLGWLHHQWRSVVLILTLEQHAGPVVPAVVVVLTSKEQAPDTAGFPVQSPQTGTDELLPISQCGQVTAVLASDSDSRLHLP
jgi:hypothetical protein